VLEASGVPAGEAAGEAPVQYNVMSWHQIRMKILKMFSDIFLLVIFLVYFSSFSSLTVVQGDLASILSDFGRVLTGKLKGFFFFLATKESFELETSWGRRGAIAN
jgi:hypothetical protein